MPKQSAPLSWAETQARRIAEQFAYELIDVELVKEATGRFLRFYIDKPGGVSLDDCERFHKQVQPLMEKMDYDYMEVSSPGADRPLKKPADFERAEGAMVELRLYTPQDGRKAYTGVLIGLRDGSVVIKDASGAELAFAQKQIALVRPWLEFDEEDLQDEVPVNDDEGEGF